MIACNDADGFGNGKSNWLPKLSSTKDDDDVLLWLFIVVVVLFPLLLVS